MHKVPYRLFTTTTNLVVKQSVFVFVNYKMPYYDDHPSSCTTQSLLMPSTMFRDYTFSETRRSSDESTLINNIRMDSYEDSDGLSSRHTSIDDMEDEMELMRKEMKDLELEVRGARKLIGQQKGTILVLQEELKSQKKMASRPEQLVIETEKYYEERERDLRRLVVELMAERDAAVKGREYMKILLSMKLKSSQQESRECVQTDVAEICRHLPHGPS